MEHCDADTLSLWALGESPSGVATEELHLAGCLVCRSELDQLRAVVTTARATDSNDIPVAPSRTVWDSIAAELELADRSVPNDAATTYAEPAPEMATVIPIRGRARGTWLVAAAAAVVGVLAGAAIVQVADQPTAPTVLANAVLDPLNVATAGGNAELTSIGSDRKLSVDVRGLPVTDGFYEVWLLDETAEKLVSLGTLGAGDTGVFPLPEGLDVAQFPIVDVSREPLDGNPAHSTDSVVRGTLSA